MKGMYVGGVCLLWESEKNATRIRWLWVTCMAISSGYLPKLSVHTLSVRRDRLSWEGVCS